jgi:Ni/Fe-hydrogenase subunit HybB-like protein
MAMFGFVYIWYLMAVLLLEIWFDYRKDLIAWGKSGKKLKNWIQRIITLFSSDTSAPALKFDNTAVKTITIIGIPSAFLLHGYVGFIFGSIKANPWWSSVLMPIVFLFSAMVSGMALVLLLYMVMVLFRKKELVMSTVDKLASYLFYTMIVAFSL